MTNVRDVDHPGTALSAGAIEVGVFVTNLERSTRFYRDLLGFSVVGEVQLPGITMRGLGLRGSVVKLVALDEPVSATNPSGVAIGLRYLTVYVDDAAKVAARCADAGAELLRPVGGFVVGDEAAARAVTAIVGDPDGNRVELCQGSPWKPVAS